MLFRSARGTMGTPRGERYHRRSPDARRPGARGPLRGRRTSRGPAAAAAGDCRDAAGTACAATAASAPAPRPPEISATAPQARGNASGTFPEEAFDARGLVTRASFRPGSGRIRDGSTPAERTGPPEAGSRSVDAVADAKAAGDIADAAEARLRHAADQAEGVRLLRSPAVPRHPFPPSRNGPLSGTRQPDLPRSPNQESGK